MLVILGTKTEAHFLRSQVGIGSESDCLLRKLRMIFDVSDSVAGLKVEKLGGWLMAQVNPHSERAPSDRRNVSSLNCDRSLHSG